MTSTRPRIAATLAAAAAIGLILASGPAPAARAQDPAAGKDEGLERLLEKLEAKDKAADAAKDKDKAEAKDKEQPKDKPKADAPKSPGKPDEVAPKDRDLDKLLEGLGQPSDKPAPDDKKPGAPAPDAPRPPEGAKPDELKGGEKDLDKELERLLGKKEQAKKKPGEKDGEQSGPLGQVIKEMRDVEERLGQPDTGEETRKRQGEIVKNLDSLIEQLKNAPSQSQGLKMIREGKKPGNQPGNQPGSQPGAMAQGAQPTRPTDPKKPSPLAGLDKSIWGQLPAQFRDEMSNVLNEHPLPTKADLIRLYYLSLGGKNANREE